MFRDEAAFWADAGYVRVVRARRVIGPYSIYFSCTVLLLIITLLVIVAEDIQNIGRKP